MHEYFEGTRTILNDDGSATYITYDHMPPVTPMTKKDALVTLGLTFGSLVAMVAVPIGIEKLVTRNINRKDIKSRQKLNKELFLKFKKKS
jgi:hypothetical protein